jgi:putative copper resistance protein D
MRKVRADAAEELVRWSASVRNHVLGERFLRWAVLLVVNIVGTMQPAVGQ